MLPHESTTTMSVRGSLPSSSEEKETREIISTSHLSLESNILHNAFAAYQTSKPNLRIKEIAKEEVCDSGSFRPKVLGDEIYACVHENPLISAGTVFFLPESEKCEEEEEKTEEKKEEGTIEEEKSKETKERKKDEEKKVDVKGKHGKGKEEKEKQASDDKETAQNAETILPDGQIAAQLDQPEVSDDLDKESESEEDNENGPCYLRQRHGYNLKSRKGIEKFEHFLEGTAGEKYFRLWIDIERLRVITDAKTKQSQIKKLRNRYLFNGGEYCMNAETLSRLGLSYASLWTEENLSDAQPDIVEPLLLYW
uniref:RGS domain-containing protein n=1 Tax=Callorhinchus milii TaxID=7868 RepID=A0A4W3GWG4_CALMI